MQALRGAQHRPPSRRRRHATGDVLVIGGAGVLGSAVLARAMGGGAWPRVQLLATAPVLGAPRGLQVLVVPELDERDPSAGLERLAALALPATALVVIDQPREREAALHCPAVDRLPALAAALHRGGVEDLALVLPHAPALLPAALREGLLNADEAALASLGLRRLLFVRPAALGPAGGTGPRPSWPDRLAAWMLGNLRWMVAARHKPVLAPQVAAFVVEAMRQWQAEDEQGQGGHDQRSHSRTRVADAELVWEAAQAGALQRVVRQWLSAGGGEAR